MNDVRLIFACISLLLFLSCRNSSIGKQRPWQQISVKSITLDTTYGYPYPSNYNWGDIAKRGEADAIPHKHHNSPTPLWKMLDDSISEVYRVDAFPYRFVIEFRAVNTTVNALFAKCNDKWVFNCLNAYDSLPKSHKLMELTAEETNSLKSHISSSQFWRLPFNGSGDFGNDGVTWEIEGIKDSVYSVVWQWVPQEYNKRLYKLGEWLISLAKRNGLK